MTKKSYQVLGLTFILSWGLALAARLAGLKYDGQINSVILGVLYMFMPALAVAILSRFVWHQPFLSWGFKRPQNYFWLLALLGPIVYAFLSAMFSYFWPGVYFSAGMDGLFQRFSGAMPPEQLLQMKNQLASLGFWVVPIFILQAVLAGMTVNAVAAWGEELLWRGFLVRELRNWHWLKMSLVIGLAWGLWHAPLIIQGHNYPQHPYLGVLMMTLWCILLTPPLIYLSAKTKSVLTAAIFHGTLNASFGLSTAWVSGGNDLLIGMTGLAGLLALLLINIFLFMLDWRGSINFGQEISNW